MDVVFFAIINLFFIILLGFYLYRKTVLTEESLKFLTFFVINLSVPFLFFSTIIRTFDPRHSPHVTTFLVLSVTVFLVGIAVGYIFSLWSPRPVRREFLSLAAFQNGGYLPMNLALFLFSAADKDTFLVYIFLYLLGFNVLMWSIGSFLIFRNKDARFELRSLCTPPVLSTAIAVVLAYTGYARYVPEVVLSPMKIIGDVSFPVSMIILGAWLAKSRIPRGFSEIKPLLNVAIVKLVIVPALFFVAALKLDIMPFLGLFIVIEASMPSAATMPIIANIHNANSEFTSQGVFFTHLVALVTVPVWIELYLKVTGFML